MEEFTDEGLVHIENRIKRPEAQEFFYDWGAQGRRENLGSGCADLGGEEAHPDFVDLRLLAPEAKELLEIAWAAGDLAGDGAVDRDAGVGYVLQDSFVGGGGSTEIVFGLQAVDGDYDVEALELLPVRWDDAEGTGDYLDVNSATVKLGDDEFELAMPDQGVASDEGDMKRPVLIDNLEDVANQLIVLVVGKLTESDASPGAEVSGIVGVAARAAQGAFTGNFDR
jgi:hypothetical protein